MGRTGGKGGAIRLYARDEQSGTYDTFKELVLASHGKSLASDARRFESNDRLAAAVSADPHAIGFVGIASVGRARALAIADGESLPMAPQESLIATEDYPLSRRLFLYLKPGEKNPGPRPWYVSPRARAARRSSPAAASSRRRSRRCRSHRARRCPPNTASSRNRRGA